MTDKEIGDLIRQYQRRNNPKYDQVGAVKMYCKFMKSNFRNFNKFLKETTDGIKICGYANIQSVRSSGVYHYNMIKRIIGRDFYNEIEDITPPPEEKETDFQQEILLQLKTLTKVCSALLDVTKEVWQHD